MSPDLLQQVRLLDGLQDVLLGRLLSFPAQQELVQDEVSLLEVKNNVQLTNLMCTKEGIMNEKYLNQCVAEICRTAKLTAVVLNKDLCFGTSEDFDQGLVTHQREEQHTLPMQ